MCALWIFRSVFNKTPVAGGSHASQAAAAQRLNIPRLNPTPSASLWTSQGSTTDGNPSTAGSGEQQAASLQRIHLAQACICGRARDVCAAHRLWFVLHSLLKARFSTKIITWVRTKWQQLFCHHTIQSSGWNLKNFWILQEYFNLKTRFQISKKPFNV